MPARRTSPSGRDAKSARSAKRVLQLPGFQEPEFRRGRGHLVRRSRLRERAFAFHNNGRGLNRAAAISPTIRQHQPPHDRSSGRAAGRPDEPTRAADSHPQENAELPHLHAQGDPRHPSRAHVHGLHRNAYHLYMFRYDPPRSPVSPGERFLKALAAEGIPCSGGYTPLNAQPFLKNALASRASGGSSRRSA